MKRYSAFGLSIASSLACPELPLSLSPPDVVVEEGDVPATLAGSLRGGVRYEVSLAGLLLRVDGVARYLVSEGRQILIQREPEAQDAAVRLFLLASAFGALLHQRGIVPLHASAVRMNGGCALFLGHSGTGKSTLAAALQQRGYPIFCDDIAALALSPEGQPLIAAGIPRVTLWRDALRRLGFAPEGLERVRPELPKYRVPCPAPVPGEQLPLKAAYVLRPNNRDEHVLTPVQGFRKVQALLSHTYRLQFLEGALGRRRHFEICAAACPSVRVATLVRPAVGFALQPQLDLVEGDLAS